MKIDDRKKIKEIQEAFQDQFPHLKIIFYLKEYSPQKKQFRNQIMNPEIRIERVLLTKDAVGININEQQKVSALKLQVKQIYDLDIQILRRSGNLWVALITPEDLTLAEQNEKGFYSTKRAIYF